MLLADNRMGRKMHNLDSGIDGILKSKNNVQYLQSPKSRSESRLSKRDPKLPTLPTSDHFSSAVAGLITVATSVIILAGNPPFFACSLTSSSLSAL